MNHHLANGIYFRGDGERIKIVRAAGFDDPGETLVDTDLNGFASLIASMSPWREGNGSFYFVYRFLRHGEMYCGGCGAVITPAQPSGSGGWLSIVNRLACKTCFEQKFKPLFDWGMTQKGTVR